MKPMLAETLATRKLATFVNNDEWFFEQKLDGHRRMVTVDANPTFGNLRHVVGRNRSGGEAQLPMPIRTEFMSFILGSATGSWVFDGELMGQKLWIFDLLATPEDTDLSPDSPMAERREKLDDLFTRWSPSTIGLLPVARTPVEKVDLTRKLLANSAEGLILKRVDAPYTEGKRSSAFMKVKFIHDIDCFVTAVNINGKANMSVAVYDEHGTKHEIAEVTANSQEGARVKVGDVVTVQYLYATEANRLYQPTRPRIRDDKGAAECLLDQLIYTNKDVIL